MKKKIIFFIILALLGLAETNALTVAIINGNITNSQTGLAIASHPVIITDSNNYTQTIYTNNAGFYSDSIGNNSTNPVKYYILIYDCNNLLHYDTVTTYGFVQKTANFSICYNFIDAGVIDIITPVNPVNVGEIIPLKVKIKNYSTQSINSLQIGFKINGQLLSPFNWVGLLSADSSTIIQIGNYTIQNQNNVNLISFTNLPGDMYHNNDTCYKTLAVTPQDDAGAIEIILPSDTVHLGDTLYPLVIIKNYGTQTITGLQIYFKSHYQLLGPFNWTGNLPHDSFDTVSIGSFFVLDPFISENLIAYTNLNGDINHNNDSCYKTIIKIAPQYDVGATSILNSFNTVMVGDTIFPKIKFKNYGCQTITNMNLAYRVNGQLISIENWSGNLLHDSSTVYTFSQYFISSPNWNSLLIFTQLNTDIFHANDSVIAGFTPIALYDAGIVEIINPDNIVCSGMQIYPKVVIKNFGTNPLTSIPLSYQRGTLTPVTATWTRITPLNLGDTVHFTFIVTFIVPIGASFNFSAFTTLPNDANTNNNKLLNPITIGAQPPASFSIVGDDTVIIGQNHVVYYCDIQFLSNIYQYIWTLPPGATIDSVYNNNISISYGNNAQSGNITCKIMDICGTSQTIVLPISVFLTPPSPIIYQNGNTLNSGYSTGNQWYFNNVAIPGADQSTYTPTNTGYYYCIVTINGSTSSQSNILYIAFLGIEDAFIKSHFEVFPNPTNNKTNFKYSLNADSKVNLKILDIEGRLISTLVDQKQLSGDYQINFDAGNLSKGIYFYNFNTGNSILNGKIIITE